MGKPRGQIGGWIAASAALALAASAQAAASAPREDFALGQSARSGAVCQAVRDFDDPLGARAGLRAWQVMCRGWTQTLGRIYAFHVDEASATKAWRASLADRAACEPARGVPDPALVKTTLAACKSKPLGVSYVVYEARAGHDVVTAEGYAAIGDVLATGVKVALGRSPPPAATSQQTANLGAAGGGQMENLNAAAEASASSPAKQKESAYREAQLWQFGDAESRFSHLAETTLAGLSLVDRAEAYLNVAINASNAGRYVEAEAYFKAAAPLVTEANSPPLKALSLNILAAHARNQRRFEDSIALAQQALAVRSSSAEPAASGLVIMVGPDLALGHAAANALNAQGKIPSLQLSAEDREAVRNAQAWHIIGTCQEALGERPQARQSLQAAVDILNRPRGTDVLGSAAPWLVVRLQVDLAGLDRADGQPQLAVRRIEAALAIYEPLDPDSLPLGRYILELARAKAASGLEEAALADFERAFAVFQIKRGALGASADAAGAYFDILIKRIANDPVTHAADAQRFFASSEALVGESTAAASLQFAERLSSEGTASAGISRAHDATLRLIAQKNEEIRQLQRAGAYVGDVRIKADAELDDLRKQANELEQRLFDANPRYATALSTTVTSKDLQSELKDGEAYLKVMLLANRGYGVLITRGEVRPYAIEMGRTQARRMAKKMRDPLSDLDSGALGEWDVDLAHQIYQTMLGPIEPQLASIHRLIYQPDPAMIGVPIGTLVTDAASVQLLARNTEAARAAKTEVSYKGVNWLAARLDTSVSISTAAFWNTRRTRPSKGTKPFLGFADPVIPKGPTAFKNVVAPAWSISIAGGADFCAGFRKALMKLPQLPEADSEVRSVAAAVGAPNNVILGAEFTDDRVRHGGGFEGALDQYRVLYFATHGLLPQANGCLQPALVTSLGGPTSESLLDTGAIPDLQLDADLVVLSACNTGAGLEDTGGGAALGGLVSTFTYAGARNLLVSNWEVNSAATEILMSALFKSKAATQGDALIEAERSFMARDDYSHPYYWAAFLIVGDGARALPRSQ
jgi:CHAT domain-containing protein